MLNSTQQALRLFRIWRRNVLSQRSGWGRGSGDVKTGNLAVASGELWTLVCVPCTTNPLRLSRGAAGIKEAPGKQRHIFLGSVYSRDNRLPS